jgi:transcriptional regulator with XRE-family HTH domain
MSHEIGSYEFGRLPEVDSMEPGPHGGLAELTALARFCAPRPLGAIGREAPAEVRIFAETLRILFGATGMSLNRLAALLHCDAGTVSRYLSGKRIPPPDFIDALCKAVYDVRGSLVTEQVHDLVHGQFLVALRAHDPARYEVQRLTDLLQLAAEEKQLHETTVAALEEAIASRNDRIYKLELQGRQLRSAWARAEGLLEEEKGRRERLEQVMEGLHAEVRALKAQLVSAQRRAAAAEERCRELETRLDSAGALLLPPDEADTEIRELEEAAERIRVYGIQFVPALLQTEEYARVIIRLGRDNLAPSEVDRQVALRMDRQKLLTRENPPRYWVILDEAALRRPMGGRDAHARQIARLIDLMGHPHVTLQLMPFTYGGHSAEAGAFTIMRFPETDVPDVVYTEYLTGAHYIDKTEEVERYYSVMERLTAEATSPEVTRKILTSMLKDI